MINGKLTTDNMTTTLSSGKWTINSNTLKIKFNVKEAIKNARYGYQIPNQKATLIFNDAVYDTNENRYNLKIEIGHVTLYDVTKPIIDEQEITDTEIYKDILTIDNNQISLNPAYSTIKNGKIRTVELKDNIQSCRYDIKISFINKQNNQTSEIFDKYFVFSTIDLDIASYQDSLDYYKKYKPNQLNDEQTHLLDKKSKVKFDPDLDNRGRGYYSEGINLNYYEILGIDVAGNYTRINPFIIDDVYYNIRATSYGEDCRSELSTALILAEADNFQFQWTSGVSGKTFILSDYQPNPVTISKLDDKGNPVAGNANLKLTVNKPNTEVSTWDTATTGAEKKLYLLPGHYRLEETEAPAGYTKSDPVAFVVNHDGSIEIEENSKGVKNGSIVNGKVVMTDKRKSCTINVYHYIEGTTNPVPLNNGTNAKNPNPLNDKTYYYRDEYKTYPLSNINSAYEVVSSTPENYSGTCNKDTIDVKYYYRKKKISTINVYHYIEGTTNPVPLNNGTNAKNPNPLNDKIYYYGTPYETYPLSNIDSKYEQVGKPSNSTGTCNQETIDVKYYYRKKKTTINVYHYLEGTTNPVPLNDGTNAKNPYKEIKDYGDKYNIKPLSNVDSKYEPVGKPTNSDGTCNSATIDVVYYYRRKRSTINVYYYIEGTEEPVPLNDGTKAKNPYIVNKYYGDKYDVVALNNVHPTYEQVTTPYTITCDKNTIDAYFYYRLKKTSISGKVWIENKIILKGEVQKYNFLYDNKDTPLAGVKVTLKRKDGNNQNPPQVTTNANGIYTFSNILYKKDMKDYYIEFDYSGTSAKTTHVPIEYKIVADGSKALPTSIPTRDSDLGGIANTYKGNVQNTENEYGLSWLVKTNLYDANKNILGNINLGLRELEDNTFNIAQEISYVKINYDGNSHKYVYGGNKEIFSENQTVPSLNYESPVSSGTYTRDIYPSDIKTNISSPGKLEVYVVYRISIKNTAFENAYYKEDQMIIQNLKEEFPSDVYGISTDINSDFDSEDAKNDFGKWDVSGNAATYKINDTNSKLKTGLQKNKVKNLYIQFKVRNGKLNQILSSNVEANVKSEVTAYHKYKRNDYIWAENPIERTNVEHETKSHTRTVNAPGMKFKLSEKERTISGVVFEDKIIGEKDGDGETKAVGNGEYDNGEKKVKGAKVELLVKNNNNTWSLANVYPKEVNGSITAETTTNDNGEYKFQGVVPGEYVLRFTYGNGTVQYQAVDYKSTIITLDSAKCAFGVYNEKKIDTSNKPNSNWYKNNVGEWYKYKEGNSDNKNDKQTYSVALDNLNDRKEVNNSTKSEIKAETPLSKITMENSISKETEAGNITITIGNDGQITRTYNPKAGNSNFNCFNFGIIKQPELESKVDKIISNLKLVNNQGNVVFDGNPETAKMQGVVDLDFKNNGGSKKAKIEISKNLIYGSTLYITYKLTVTNESKYVEYVEMDDDHFGYYYKYGITGGYSKKVTINVEEILDYLDSSIEAIKPETQNDQLKLLRRKEATDLWYDMWTKQEVLYKFKGTGKINRADYDELIAIVDVGTLKKGDPPIVFNITTKRMLSEQDDDIDIGNDIEITKTTKTINGYKPDDVKEKLALVKNAVSAESANANVIVTPPTGEDKQAELLQIATIGIGLMISAMGILILKRLVK